MKKAFLFLSFFLVFICLLGCDDKKSKAANQEKVMVGLISTSDEADIVNFCNNFIEVQINNTENENDLKRKYYSKNFWAIGGESLMITIVNSYKITEVSYEKDSALGSVAYVKIEYVSSGYFDVNKYYANTKKLKAIIGIVKEDNKLKILTINELFFRTKDGAIKFANSYKDDKSVLYQKISKNILTHEWK